MMKNKETELVIKVPRLRMSDGKRLIFKGGMDYGWEDIDAVPEYHPIYPMPEMKRKFYNLGSRKIYINPGCTINDVVRQVIKGGDWTDSDFLHTMEFMKDGNLFIKYETI